MNEIAELERLVIKVCTEQAEYHNASGLSIASLQAPDSWLRLVIRSIIIVLSENYNVKLSIIEARLKKVELGGDK